MKKKVFPKKETLIGQTIRLMLRRALASESMAIERKFVEAVREEDEHKHSDSASFAVGFL